MTENTVYVGNLSEKVTEDLLYELFLQAGPVVHVNIPRQKPFGFVRFKHQCSVPYVISLLEGVSLFGKTLKVNPPRGASVPPSAASMGQRPLIQPLSQHGRLGPMEPRNARRGGRQKDEERSDLRDRLKPRSRHNDPMLPSSHPKRIEPPSIKDMDAIPDFLGSGFDPLYSSGPFVPPYQMDGRNGRDRGRDHRNHNRHESNADRGHHRRDRHEEFHRSQNNNPRRDRSPRHSSRRRKHF